MAGAPHPPPPLSPRLTWLTPLTLHHLEHGLCPSPPPITLNMADAPQPPPITLNMVDAPQPPPITLNMAGDPHPSPPPRPSH